jgi:membrane protein implicated in regulation of membrane protease activity
MLWEFAMFPINDILDAILLGGFFFGLLFTLGVLVLGVADVGFHAHGDVAGGHDVVGHGDGFFHGMFNVSALLAFITWFGGVGYVARNGLGLWAWAAILLGLAGGFIGAAIITWFIVKVLRNNSQEMNPADWELVGVIGRVVSSIRPEGYGEIVYEQNGVRLTTSAKATGGGPIPRNTEVVVLRVERGVAIVEPFEDLLHERDSLGATMQANF